MLFFLMLKRNFGLDAYITFVFIKFIFKLQKKKKKKKTYLLGMNKKANIYIYNKVMTAVGFEPTPFRTRA